MKALQVIAPGEASVVDIPAPRPQPGEVLLRVRMVGMCGSDLSTFGGKNPLVTYPRILGHEIAATVIDSSLAGGTLAVGTNVTVSPYTSCGRCPSCLRQRPNACQFNETLGVQRDGAMTEFLSVPAGKLYAAEGLELPELALVEPLTVGFHAAARGRITEKDVVAVFGCGGVGLGAIAGSARRGATVIAIDIDDAKLRLAKLAGARHAIHSGNSQLHEELLDLTDSRGPDVVIEAIGVPATFRAAVEEVAFTGRVVYIGYAKQPVSYETRLFVQKEIDVLGSRNALPEDFDAVIQMLRRREFPVKETISRVVQINETPDVLRRWSAAPGEFSKILVSFLD